MTGWEERLLATFEDLEQQAEGLALAERDARVADLSRAEYGGVDLAARLHAAVGHAVRLGVCGVGVLQGTVLRVGTDWLLVADADVEWVVRVSALDRVQGLPDRAVDGSGRPVSARLGLGSVLRSIAADGAPVLVHSTTGTVLRSRVHRVGADFVELAPDETGPDDGGVTVVPWHALAAVRRG